MVGVVSQRLGRWSLAGGLSLNMPVSSFMKLADASISVNTVQYIFTVAIEGTVNFLASKCLIHCWQVPTLWVKCPLWVSQPG